MTVKFSIEYCTQWNYAPQAAGLAAELKESFEGCTVELIQGSGGAFEVTADGRLIYSKHKEKRFPAYQEVPTLLT